MPRYERLANSRNQVVKGLSREGYGQYDLHDAKALNGNVEAVWKTELISLESDQDNSVHGKK